MAGCILCSENDHPDHRRVYSTCDIVDGQRCDPCTEYLEIEAQIERTRQTLQDQLRRSREQKEKINRMHDPMNRVPREITMPVFEFAASVEIPTKGSSTLPEGELYAPLPLGRVCAAWRDIAWGMPQLWNFIFARFPDNDRFPSRLDIATQWLKRSGDSLPLSIHFSINWKIEDEMFIPFIELLNRYSDRWKDLCGFAPPKLFGYLSAKIGGAQTLSNLRLSSRPDDERVNFDLGCNELPQLRRVRLDLRGQPQVNITLDWTHVTIFETNCLFPFVLLNLIPNLPELTELRVHDLPTASDNIDLDHPFFFHPKLRRLHLFCSITTAVQEICELLVHLDLGSVQDITLDFMESIAIFSAFVGSIRQSQCAHRSLRSLSLWDPNPSSTVAFGELLECAESLEELVFCMTRGRNTSILEALLQPIQRHADAVQHSTPYLSSSKLQRLKYHARHPEYIPWDLLLSIFEGSFRADNCPPMKSLSVFCGLPSWANNYGLDEETIQRLIGLVDAGIELFLFGKTMSRDDLVALPQNSTTR